MIEFVIPTWVLILVALLTIPIWIIGEDWLRQRQNERELERLREQSEWRNYIDTVLRDPWEEMREVGR